MWEVDADVITIGIDRIATEITDAVRTYTLDVTAAIEDVVDITATKVLKEVKRLARKRSGEYARTFVKTRKKLPGQRVYYVWNKKHYRRVHLLERGHAKVGGGRVQAYPHLIPAHDKYAPEMYTAIINILRNGG